MALDQSSRYSDLSLKEEDLIEGGNHILVAYKMKPAAGYGYLEVAAHFAAESSPALTWKSAPPTTSPRVLMLWSTTSTKPTRICVSPIL